MVLQLAKEQSARLLKHVVRCYLRLSDNPRAREALRQCLPDQLKDNTFANCLKDDNSTKKWLAQLLKNLESAPDVRGAAALSSGPSLMSGGPGGQQQPTQQPGVAGPPMMGGGTQGGGGGPPNSTSGLGGMTMLGGIPLPPQ